MTDAEKKLKQLQTYLGDKKLKQLGLIPCSTCSKILSQLMNITLPSGLEDKSFFTIEEMAAISQSILDATYGSLKSTPSNISNEMEHTDTNTTSTTISKEPTTTVNESTSAYSTSSLKSEKELVAKLLAIISQSQQIVQEDLGIGYIYTPPKAALLTHSLSCSECGHLYAILTSPTLHLMPLPVYLSDTEYEMIKGIYVDILL